MVYVRLFSIFHEHIHKYFSLYIIIIICRFIVSELKMILLISASHLTEYAMILYLLSCRVDLLFIHFILFKKIFFFLLFNNENSTGYCYWCGAMLLLLLLLISFCWCVLLLVLLLLLRLWLGTVIVIWIWSSFFLLLLLFYILHQTSLNIICIRIKGWDR